MDHKSQWTAIEERMSKVCDRLGKPIDAGIMNICVGLVANDVNTTFSCEGHLDRGEAYPWVRVGADDVSDLEQELRRALQADHKFSNGGPAPFSTDTKQAELALKRRHAGERQKLSKLLTEFYEDRRGVDYDVRLVIEPIGLGGQCLLQSQGADLQEVRDQDEQAVKFAEYRAEMDAFAAFLKRRFFG